MRTAAGRNPSDRALSNFVGELSVASDEFRALWANHTVREHRTGAKYVQHPVVSDMNLTYESLDITSHKGFHTIAYAAQPGSASHDSMQLLTNWAATNDSTAAATPASTTPNEAR